MVLVVDKWQKYCNPNYLKLTIWFALLWYLILDFDLKRKKYLKLDNVKRESWFNGKEFKSPKFNSYKTISAEH